MVLKIFKFLAFGPVLAGYICLTQPAEAKSADSISDIIAQRMPEQLSVRTVAVFQKDDGTQCRIREQGAVLSVECHIGGKWILRPAKVMTAKEAEALRLATLAAKAAAKTAQNVVFAMTFG